MSKHNQNNYFERNIKQSGPNFIQLKNARDLQFEALIMFKDLVRGKIDVREYEEYFRDPQFLESCLFKAMEKHTFHYISMSGVSMLLHNQNPQLQNDPQVLAVLDFHQKASAGFKLLYDGLDAFKTTGQIELLLPIAGQLRNYRDYIN